MRRFAIMGSFRSGTTILRLSLNSHPNICCYDEIMSYGAARALQSNDTLDGLSPDVHMVGLKLPAWTEFAALPQYARFYQGVPILFCARDCRDVVASLQKYQPLGRPYLDKIAGDVDKWARDGHTLTAAQREEVLGLKDNYEKGAFFWRIKQDAFEAMKKAGLDVKAVRYSDLVQKPQETLQGVLDHLRVDWSPDVLLPRDKGERGIGGTYAHPIHKMSLGRYAETLTPDQIERVMQVATR